MTRRSFVTGVAGCCGAPLSSRAAEPLVPVDEEGFRRIITAHRGQILLVDFWATWCAPCREELPRLVQLYGTYSRRGLEFVTISCDDPPQAPQAAAFVAQQKAPTPRYIRRAKSDDGFINAIDPKWSGALPALFVFDRSGRQALSFIGETDMKRLEAAITKLLPA